MKTIQITLILCLLWFTSNAQADSVPVSTFEELKLAIEMANAKPAGSLTSISIDTHSTIYIPADNDPLPAIRSSIEISGGKIEEKDGGSAQLFVIERGASLHIQNLTFKDIPHSGYGPTLFRNSGELRIEQVEFINVSNFPFCTGKGGCVPSKTAIIENEPTGNLTMHRVEISNSGGIGYSFSPLGEANGFLTNEGWAELSRVGLYLNGLRWNTPLYNSGLLRVINSSFLAHKEYHIELFPLVDNAEGAQTEFVSAIIDGFSGGWCSSTISLGHNLTDSDECNWASDGDLVGLATGLMAKESSDGAVHLRLSAASPAIDSADEAWCPIDYLHEEYDGNIDGVSGCDRGAYEQIPRRLAEGGINGVYYNPDADGHYVYIQETDYTTLVMWNTFDSEGNHVWIFGTGELKNGHSFIAEAYINRIEDFNPNDLENGVTAEHWGQLEVVIESCNKGEIAYKSVLPEFGSGQFPVKRLGYVKQLACIDP